MNDLFLSEWRRFRRTTLVATACHALALLFLSRVTHLLHRGWDDHALMLAIYTLLGLALGVVQVGAYRAPSRWLWLIHRPLAPARIFGALALAGLAALATAIGAPLVVFVLATDVLSTQVVDARHYALPLVVLAFAAMAWLSGAIACVGRTRLLVAVLAAPLLLALHLASVWWLFVPVLACLAWLAWIAVHAFRADRGAPIARPGVLLATALPLQLAFFVLLFQLGKVAVDVADVVTAPAPARTVLATDPGVDDLQRTMAQDSVIRGLENSTDPRAASWREQLRLLDVVELAADLERFPVRHQVGNVATPRWDDTRGVEWTVSHDRMKALGRVPKTGEARGWWGATGAGSAQPLDAIPLRDLTASTVLAIDDAAQAQHELVRLPDGERLVGAPVRGHDRLLLLTNRRVLAYAADRGTTSPFAPPRLDWALDLPGDQPAWVSVVELLDGWLVSVFRYAGPEYAGFEALVPHRQQVHYVDASGATLVGERDVRGQHITLGSAPLAPQASWWVSPPLYALARWPSTALDLGLTRAPRLALLPEVPLFRWLAVASTALSLALAAWWLRGPHVRASRRRLWLATCAFAGLPAFLSLVCLEPRAARR